MFMWLPVQAASKPLPPWLMSAYKQQQQHGHPQEQQQQHHGHPQEQQQQQDASADVKDVAKVEQGLGLKPEPDSLALKEEVKPECRQVRVEAEGVLLLLTGYVANSLVC
jgi:hypothetical protein